MPDARERRAGRGRSAAPDAAQPPRAAGRAPSAALWVACLALLANLPTLFVPFVMDDHPIVERDPRIVEGRLLEPWTTSYWNDPTESGEYRPLVLTSYALERKLLGDRAWHFHLINLLLHAAVAIAVLAAGRAIGLGERAAVVAAGLFALHPVHLDAIAPVVGRAELLAALGYTIPVALWLRIRRETAVAPGRLLALAACVALGIFSKENALAVVPLLLLVEILLLRGGGARRTLVASGVAVGAVVAVYLVARVAVLGALLPAEGSGTIVALENPLAEEPLRVRWLTAASILGTYLRLFAWPFGLSPDYAYDSLPVVRAALDPAVWLPVLAVGAVGLLALLRLRRRPAIALGVVAFLAPYAIVSNSVFLIGTMLAERLLYQPSVGLCWLTGMAVAAAADRAPRGALRAPERLALALALPAALLGAASFARANDWRDEAELYRTAAQAYPRNFLLQRNLGSLAMEAGRFPEALYYMTRVTELVPDYAKGWSDRGFLHLATGDPDAAVAALERSIELDPRQPTALRNLAEAYRSVGRFKDSARIDARLRELRESLGAAP
ncbi:MAG: tetratricopeptide repeat protein [Deltaproteobacteria bacterium]|nr:MAG: tetratricopeptide repeat protein [Deltaproteobacteria bacterium]